MRGVAPYGNAAPSGKNLELSWHESSEVRLIYRAFLTDILLRKSLFLSLMVEPLCPYFGECGGCTFQHIPYDAQLENKRKELASHIEFQDIKVFSGAAYHYRNRMDFVFHPGGLGLRKKGKWHQIKDIPECVISDERLNNLLKEVRSFFQKPDSFDLKKHNGTLKYAVIRTPSEDSSVSFVLNEESSSREVVEQKIGEFAAKTTANNIIITFVPPKTDASVSEEFIRVKGSDMLKESYLGREFLYSVQGFFQNNHAMAEQMQEYCHDLFNKYQTKNAHLLDLYGGVGTFGIINASLFKTVTIVESVPGCIDAAKQNIQKNNTTNASALLLNAKTLKKLELRSPLFVLTDPPRSGMHPKTIEELGRLRPEVIIYVSCNVQQLGRDVKKFSDYDIKSAALFDLFPQTPHSEAVIELVRKR